MKKGEIKKRHSSPRSVIDSEQFFSKLVLATGPIRPLVLAVQTQLLSKLCSDFRRKEKNILDDYPKKGIFPCSVNALNQQPIPIIKGKTKILL